MKDPEAFTAGMENADPTAGTSISKGIREKIPRRSHCRLEVIQDD
jgi:hypothetical protein